MNRIALLLTYEGTAFFGYQVQPNKRTVQGEMERALMQLHKGEQVRVHSSGRTDTGVHARGQVLHFDSPLNLKEWQWPKALNSCLPNDIHILKAARVPDTFHARFDAIKKHYRYRVLISEEPDVFRRNMTYYYAHPLCIETIQKAAGYLLGTHDFTSFCAASSDVEDKVRTLYNLSIEKEQDELIFNISGNGFLHHMVRIIVGTLLEIGSGKRSPDELTTILAAKDRSSAGKTAPGQGLFLWEVCYEQNFFSKENRS